jgi:hypothetical protein
MHSAQIKYLTRDGKCVIVIFIEDDLLVPVVDAPPHPHHADNNPSIAAVNFLVGKYPS